MRIHTHSPPRTQCHVCEDAYRNPGAGDRCSCPGFTRRSPTGRPTIRMLRSRYRRRPAENSASTPAVTGCGWTNSIASHGPATICGPYPAGRETSPTACCRRRLSRGCVGAYSPFTKPGRHAFSLAMGSQRRIPTVAPKSRQMAPWPTLIPALHFAAWSLTTGPEFVQNANVGEISRRHLERLATGAFFVALQPRLVPKRSRFVADVASGVARSPQNSRIFADIRDVPKASKA